MRHLSVVAVALAVIVAAVSAVYVSNRRAAQARARADEAERAADAASSAAKEAEANRQAEVEKRRAAEAQLKAAEAQAKTAEESRLQAEANKAAAETERQAEELALARAEAESRKSADERDIALARLRTAQASNETAKAEAAAAASRAQTAADELELEQVKSEKIIAEAKALELRKLDLDAYAADLVDYKRELDEREATLRPEKTIESLSWAGGMEDSVVDDKGNVTKVEKKPYDPTTDRKLPVTSRALAKAEREAKGVYDDGETVVRDGVVSRLERLYVESIREDRVIDAEYYRKSILVLYPDWKFKGEAKK